eukprot:3709294-Pleurochrysis_carterae.AAC.2
MKVVATLEAEQVRVSFLDAPPLQVDLDLQSCPDHPFKFLLNYQDHGVSFMTTARWRAEGLQARAQVLARRSTPMEAPPPEYELRETSRRKRMRELLTAHLDRQAGKMKKSALGRVRTLVCPRLAPLFNLLSPMSTALALMLLTSHSLLLSTGGEEQGRRPEDAVRAFRCSCSCGADAARAWVGQYGRGLTQNLGIRAADAIQSVLRLWSGSCALLGQLRHMRWGNVRMLQGRAHVQLTLPQGQTKEQQLRRH